MPYHLATPASRPDSTLRPKCGQAGQYNGCMTTPQIGPLLPEDWPAVRAIYEAGIATGVATFETKAPSWPEWDQDHIESCRYIARQKERVLGWAALSPVSGR